MGCFSPRLRDLFYPQTKLAPTIPTLLRTSFTYTTCHTYLSGLITTAHHCCSSSTILHCLSSLHQLEGPILGCQHYSVELTALPLQAMPSVPFRWLDWCQSWPLDHPAPTPHASKDRHIIQSTLPDQDSVERWIYDHSPANQLAQD